MFELITTGLKFVTAVFAFFCTEGTDTVVELEKNPVKMVKEDLQKLKKGGEQGFAFLMDNENKGE